LIFAIIKTNRNEIMNEAKYKPIGVIHSPFKEPQGTPIQPAGGKGIEGMVEVFPEYAEGLKDVEGFSHIILIYHFHLSKEPLLKVKPYMDNEAHGVFAMRGPSRPNPIGISVVRLIKIRENILHIQDVDIVDGTPLLDIKPYVPEFDIRQAEKIGWLEKKVHKLSTSKDDGRFTIC
jgi:tRNA-Thr(GGU) m(6)t(6)A37 methyltransferase TsaA